MKRTARGEEDISPTKGGDKAKKGRKRKGERGKRRKERKAGGECAGERGRRIN